MGHSVHGLQILYQRQILLTRNDSDGFLGDSPLAWPTPPASHGNGPSLKEQKEKRPRERAGDPQRGGPEGCGGLGLTAWSPGPEHHSWAWADMHRDTWVLVRPPWASWVGWGVLCPPTCSHPFLPPNGRVGKICSTWKEKGFQADILPGRCCV